MMKGLDPLLCSNINDCVREQKKGLLGQYKGQQKFYALYYHERSNFKPLPTSHTQLHDTDRTAGINGTPELLGTT
jgi:hypothetical protein